MDNPLVKYSKLKNIRNRIFLYSFFVILCSIVGIIYGLYLPLVPMSTVKMMLLPILLIGLIGIWMMPERETFFENKTRVIFYVFLLFWCLWPEYLSLVELPGDPWMSPQRVLIYIILIMALLMYSVSINAKQRLGNSYKENKAIFIIVLVFMLASFVSIFFSANMELSTTYLIKDLMFNFLVFFLAATLIHKEEHLKTIFKICIFSAIVLSLMAFYENSLNQTIWSYHLPRNFFAGGEEMQKILSPKFRFGDYRVKGSSLTSLEYAELLSYILPMCLYYFLDNKNKAIKSLMILVMILMFYAIIVSRSRLGLVGAIIGISSYSFLISIRTWQINKQSLTGAALMTLYPAGISTLGFLIASSQTLTNMILGSSGHAASTNARPEQWAKGLPMIAERPFFGYGLNMGATTLDYRTPGGTLTIDTYLLQIMIETGILGGLAFVSIFILGGIKAAKHYSNSQIDDGFAKMGAAIASILLSFIVIKLVLSQRGNHPLLFLLLGSMANFYLLTDKKALNHET